VRRFTESIKRRKLKKDLSHAMDEEKNRFNLEAEIKLLNNQRCELKLD